jgi:hypothetical protein
MIWKIATIALIIVVILLARCKGCKEAGTIVKTDIVTTIIHDTVPFSTIVYVPQPYAIEQPVYVEGKEVIREVDTAAILKDYYSTRFYSDTQSLDRATVIINDQISENRIKQRQVYGNVIHDSIKTTITNTIVLPRKNELYGGVISQGGDNSPMSLGGSILFVQKKGWGIEAAALIDTKGNLIYQGSLKLKLK